MVVPQLPSGPLEGEYPLPSKKFLWLPSGNSHSESSTEVGRRCQLQVCA